MLPNSKIADRAIELYDDFEIGVRSTVMNKYGSKSIYNFFIYSRTSFRLIDVRASKFSTLGLFKHWTLTNFFYPYILKLL